jgi:hypothetical protein
MKLTDMFRILSFAGHSIVNTVECEADRPGKGDS